MRPAAPQAQLIVGGLGIPEVMPATAEELYLRSATANVLTLLPGKGATEAGTRPGGRAAALSSQFTTAGLHLVGLQDTRNRSEDPAHMGDFRVFSGRALANGCHLAQLRANTRAPVGGEDR